MKRCATCDQPLNRSQRKYCSKECKPSAFAPDHKPYGTYEGVRGHRAQWEDAFQQRFSPEEIVQHLGGNSAWVVLGIPPGSSKADIQQAYRTRARATHPDLNPGMDRKEFQAVLAAYQRLMEAFA